MSVEALSSGEGLSGACLPLTWPCLSLFLLLLLFYAVWKTAGFPSLLARLRRWAQHVRCGESLPLSRLQVFSLGGNLLSSLSLDEAASLLVYKEHLATPPSPSWGPALHKRAMGSLPTSWCLVWGSAEGQKCKDKEYSQAWDLDGARSCGHSTAAFNGEWL